MSDFKETLREKIRHLPNKPGCYLFRDRNGRIIYVGKAVSLRKRVQSYFRESTLRKASPKLRSLINSVADLDHIAVRNEAEALLTEGRLIKDYKPRFNVVFRDDKRYLAIRAETHHPFPRFVECRIVRNDGNEYFGPFPSSSVVRIVKDFVERRYGIRKCPYANPGEDEHKHCHNDRIAQCSAPCIGTITEEDYRKQFELACEFIRNGNAEEMENLNQEMANAVAELNFERAAQIRDTIHAIREMVRQRAREVSTPSMKREKAMEGCKELAEILGLPTTPQLIEGFDISHISGTFTVGSMVAAVDGVPMPQRYRRFRIKTVQGIDDTASMAEVVHRRYSRLKKENSRLPDLVVVDGGITQLRSARDELAVMGMEELPVIGLAERLEEIVIDKPDKHSIVLPRESEALKVLMRLRDEAHRFA
ncbi:MAG: excinuclease ABC subunit UvrC, partial [Lentisphaerae bacterium]|nr:excinuclease ABC subunit UvrC [Lentisphaerota bacterium]